MCLTVPFLKKTNSWCEVTDLKPDCMSSRWSVFREKVFLKYSTDIDSWCIPHQFCWYLSRFCLPTHTISTLVLQSTCHYIVDHHLKVLQFLTSFCGESLWIIYFHRVLGIPTKQTHLYTVSNLLPPATSHTTAPTVTYFFSISCAFK